MPKKSGGISKGGGGGSRSSGGGGFKGGGGGISKGGGFGGWGGGSISRPSGGIFGRGSARTTIGTPRPARTMDPGKARASQQRRQTQQDRQAEWDGQRGSGLPPFGGIPGYGGMPGYGGQSGYYDQGGVTWAQQAQMLQRQFANLQDDIMLTSVHDSMGQVEGQLATLSSRLAELRNHGYVFANFLEPKVESLTDQWESLRDQIDDDVEAQSGQLTQEASRVQMAMQQLFNGHTQLLPQVASAVQSLGQQASAAREALLGRTSGVAQGITEVNSHIQGAEFLLSRMAQASFPLLEGESIVAMTQARLFGDDSDVAEGILYLTDDRLLFEQQEMKPTKKFLFFVLESEQVQELVFTALLGWITKMDVQDKGGLFSESQELLTVSLSSEASRPYATFQILGSTNEAWASVIQRAKNGDLERERIDAAVAEKAATEERVAEIPTVCPNCGAQLPTEIVRGQRTLKCSYCGFEIRLRS